MSDYMETWPESVYLEASNELDDGFDHYGDTDWDFIKCEPVRVNCYDIRYIRCDIYASLQLENLQLKSQLKDLQELCFRQKILLTGDET